jgi:trans-feruloyl-CoA hydratase/vanillin synthase
VLELADKLMAKSPNVLKATKQAVRMVRTMDFDQSYDYLAAKGQAIKVGDVQDSYNTGLKQFLDEKSYKPTFQPFALKKPAAKKANAKKSSKKAVKKPTRRK